MSKVTRPKRIRPNRTDLNPDGVHVRVDWRSVRPGMSVFIPACNTRELIAQFYELTTHWGWVVKHAIRVENKKLGVRFWRFA